MNAEKRHVVHLTSVHRRRDTRILLRECRALYESGFKVTLVVADGEGDMDEGGIHIRDAGRSSGKLGRMLFGVVKVLKIAVALNTPVYHFHDPELIPAGLFLKLFKGKRVVYDVHDEVSFTILSRTYIPRIVKPVLAFFVRLLERFASKRFDAIVAATPKIAQSFAKLNANVVNVNNFPFKDELISEVNWKNRKNSVCYVGDLTALRGVKTMVESLDYVDATLHLGGKFSDPGLEDELRAKKAWNKVVYHGFVDRKAFRNILAESKAGLVTVLPDKNYLQSQPTKMFEYMSAGIPVIASDFPYFRQIIEENACGICVDPLDPKSIAEAIHFILTQDDAANRMGMSGLNLIRRKYNWSNEREKLCSLYSSLMPS